MEKHVTAVAILHIGFGILGVLLGVLVFALLFGLGAITADRDAALILWPIGLIVGTLFVALSAVGVVGGAGLLKHKNWARILILVVSAMDLVNIPIGTAVGVYSIWALVQPETVSLFQ